MEYVDLSLIQLKEIARNMNIPHISSMRKGEIILAIQQAEAKKAEADSKTIDDTKVDIESEAGDKIKTEISFKEDTDIKKVNNDEYLTDENLKSQTLKSEEKRSEIPKKRIVSSFNGRKTESLSKGRESTLGNRQPLRNEKYTSVKRMKEDTVQVRAESDDSIVFKQEQRGLPSSQVSEQAPYPDNKVDKKPNVSPQILALIGDKPEEIAKDALDVNYRLGMSVDRLFELASGEKVEGFLEVIPESGYGFIRSDNFFSGEKDIYVASQMIKRFGLKTGDYLCGGTRIRVPSDEKGSKYAPLLFIKSVNGDSMDFVKRRPDFEKLTPVYPDERIHLAGNESPLSLRMMDLLSPIGKGQRGMIVSPPKAGKTTLLKQIAKSVISSNPDMSLIVLLIDERPEEVTDIKEAIERPGVDAQVIYSTFDEMPEHHKKVAEMVLNRAKRLVEHGKDVMILLDSITRLARAYNHTVTPSGRTLSGGLDPAALFPPKRFFGAARNMRQGGSLTILATALVDTGSRMDDVIFEEFKGTGNMELVLDRKLSEKRVFPAIDIAKSGTRNDNLLLTSQEQDTIDYIRKSVSGLKSEEACEAIVNLFAHTRNNDEFMNQIKKTRLI